MQDSLVTETAKTAMTMNNLNLLPKNDTSEHGEEREYGGHGGFAVDNQEWNMIYFKTIRQIVNSCATFIGMCDNDDFMTAIDQLRRDLVDVTFNPPWLRKEEVTDHGDIVRHLDGRILGSNDDLERLFSAILRIESHSR